MDTIINNKDPELPGSVPINDPIIEHPEGIIPDPVHESQQLKKINRIKKLDKMPKIKRVNNNIDVSNNGNISTTKKKFEFSKMLAVNLLISYYAGIFIGVFSVIKDSTNVSYLLTYIGGVVGIGLPFFLWKAKAENVIKIKKDAGIQVPFDDSSNSFNNF
jgi:hypothetical protein